MRLLREVIDTLRSAPWFGLGLLLALVAAGFNGLMVFFMVLGLRALLPGPFAQMGHFTEPHHRIHDLTFAFLFLPAIVGVLAQLRRPAQNVAAMWMALLALTGVAAVPLLVFAAANIGSQGSAGDEHAAAGHYGFMAAFAFTVIGIGVLASLRPVGWRLPAWVAGLLPVLLGAASLIYPDASSSLTPLWAIAAIGWGAAYVVTAEVVRAGRDNTA